MIVVMANQPKTPLRAVRIPDEIWHPAMQRAIERRESLSVVIRTALEHYIEEGKP
jgi:hypothetical protein